MTHLYHYVPSWFLGYDLLFELVFAIIALVISIYAFKVYKLTEQKQSKIFGIAFLLISTSYFIQIFLNFILILRLNENISLITKIIHLEIINTIGIYSYMFFFIAGLITLTYMTLKIKSIKTYSLLFIVIILSILLCNNTYMFFLISSILLSYILIHYIINYINKKQAKTLLVLFAFAFLLFSSIHFIFSVNHEIYYVIGHFFELIAYILIFINLVLALKK